MPYGLACLWTLALFGSFAGWGALLGRLLLGEGEGDLGDRAAWGLALAIALGGPANLARLISPAALVGWTALGLVAFAVDLATRSRSRSRAGRPDGPPIVPAGPGWRVAAGVAIVVALLKLAGSSHAIALDRHDDRMAYLSFSAQMLETGGMTDDPFGSRRIESGLGGMTLLNAFSLAAMPVDAIRQVDYGVGLLALLAGAYGLARSRCRAGAWVLPVLLVVLDRDPGTNVTAMVIPVALLLAIWRALGREGGSAGGGHAALLGLLAAALVTLKSSLIPMAFFVFALDFLPRIGRPEAWRSRAIGLAVGLAVLAPWMVAMKRSSGTYLYPILGVGTHGSQYGTFLGRNSEFSPPVLARNYYEGLFTPMALCYEVSAGAALACWLGRGAGPGGRRPEDLAMVLAPGLSWATMLSLFEEVEARRFNHSMFLAGLIASSVVLLRRSGDARREARGATIALACFAFFLGARSLETRVGLNLSLLSVRNGLAGRHCLDPALPAVYREVQAAIPPGEPILAHVDDCFLLDFRRNPISIADWPGGASPRPGMPSFKGAEPLAAYLLGLSIRYVAHSYDNVHPPHPPVPGQAFFNRVADRHLDDFNANLAELMKTRHRAYDRGGIVVLDLAAPAP